MRAGHATNRAALIYQHATEDRDCEFGARMGAVVERELSLIDRSGTSKPALPLPPRHERIFAAAPRLGSAMQERAVLGC